MPLKHKHVIVKADVNRPPFEPGPVKEWLSQLISDLGMNVMMGPYAEYCTLDDNEGMTAMAILSTSHCVLHTWDHCEQPFIQFDLYTCSDLDLTVVWEALEFFKAFNIEYKYLDREHGLVEINS